MAKAKTKTKAKPRAQRPRALEQPETSAPDTAVRLQQLAKAWSSEVKRLQEQRFESLDQAIDATVDAALSKLAVKPEDLAAHDLRSFVRTIIEADPEIHAELRRIFSVTK